MIRAIIIIAALRALFIRGCKALESFSDDVAALPEKIETPKIEKHGFKNYFSCVRPIMPTFIFPQISMCTRIKGKYNCRYLKSGTLAFKLLNTLNFNTV